MKTTLGQALASYAAAASYRRTDAGPADPDRVGKAKARFEQALKPQGRDLAGLGAAGRARGRPTAHASVDPQGQDRPNGALTEEL